MERPKIIKKYSKDSLKEHLQTRTFRSLIMVLPFRRSHDFVHLRVRRASRCRRDFISAAKAFFPWIGMWPLLKLSDLMQCSISNALTHPEGLYKTSHLQNMKTKLTRKKLNNVLAHNSSTLEASSPLIQSTRDTAQAPSCRR